MNAAQNDGKGLSHGDFFSPRLLESASREEHAYSFPTVLRSGFGTELDLRDYSGNLVVSHDIADSTCLAFSDFLELYRNHGEGLYLAINIKADGLHRHLLQMLDTYNVDNYFFDMSIPDALGYLNHRMNFFTRQSECETVPSLYRTRRV